MKNTLFIAILLGLNTMAVFGSTENKEERPVKKPVPIIRELR